MEEKKEEEKMFTNFERIFKRNPDFCGLFKSKEYSSKNPFVGELDVGSITCVFATSGTGYVLFFRCSYFRKTFQILNYYSNFSSIEKREKGKKVMIPIILSCLEGICEVGRKFYSEAFFEFVEDLKEIHGESDIEEDKKKLLENSKKLKGYFSLLVESYADVLCENSFSSIQQLMYHQIGTDGGEYKKKYEELKKKHEGKIKRVIDGKTLSKSLKKLREKFHNITECGVENVEIHLVMDESQNIKRISNGVKTFRWRENESNGYFPPIAEFLQVTTSLRKEESKLDAVVLLGTGLGTYEFSRISSVKGTNLVDKRRSRVKFLVIEWNSFNLESFKTHCLSEETKEKLEKEIQQGKSEKNDMSKFIIAALSGQKDYKGIPIFFRSRIFVETILSDTENYVREFKKGVLFIMKEVKTSMLEYFGGKPKQIPLFCSSLFLNFHETFLKSERIDEEKFFLNLGIGLLYSVYRPTEETIESIFNIFELPSLFGVLSYFSSEKVMEKMKGVEIDLLDPKENRKWEYFLKQKHGFCIFTENNRTCLKVTEMIKILLSLGIENLNHFRIFYLDNFLKIHSCKTIYKVNENSPEVSIGISIGGIVNVGNFVSFCLNNKVFFPKILKKDVYIGSSMKTKLKTSPFCKELETMLNVTWELVNGNPLNFYFGGQRRRNFTPIFVRYYCSGDLPTEKSGRLGLSDRFFKVGGSPLFPHLLLTRDVKKGLKITDLEKGITDSVSKLIGNDPVLNMILYFYGHSSSFQFNPKFPIKIDGKEVYLDYFVKQLQIIWEDLRNNQEKTYGRLFFNVLIVLECCLGEIPKKSPYSSMNILESQAKYMSVSVLNSTTFTRSSTVIASDSNQDVVYSPFEEAFTESLLKNSPVLGKFKYGQLTDDVVERVSETKREVSSMEYFLAITCFEKMNDKESIYDVLESYFEVQEIGDTFNLINSKGNLFQGFKDFLEVVKCGELLKATKLGSFDWEKLCDFFWKKIGGSETTFKGKFESFEKKFDLALRLYIFNVSPTYTKLL